MPRSVYAARLREFPDIAFADRAAFQLRGGWAELFGKRMGPSFNKRIVLEIGCFDAVYLSTIAAEHPETAFVGIDWKCKAIYDGATHIAQRGLRNVVLLRARARDLLKMFAEAEVDEIWVFHPDPCDRESELKNRLIDERFLVNVHRVLKDQTSVLALKTDHKGYHESVLDLFGSAAIERASLAHHRVRDHFQITMNSADYWHDAAAISHTAKRHFAGKRTLFEDRFLRRRKPIFYLEMEKK